MPNEASIEIARKRERSAVYLTAGLLIMVLGLLILIFPANFTPHRLNPYNATFIVQAIGASIMIGAGIYSYILAARMAVAFPAMVISDVDIYNHTGSPGDGLINWSDIEEFRETDIHGKPFVTVLVKHPQEYIERQRDRSKRQALLNFYNKYGSPIVISASRVDYNLDSLMNLLRSRLAAYRATH